MTMPVLWHTLILTLLDYQNNLLMMISMSWGTTYRHKHCVGMNLITFKFVAAQEWKSCVAAHANDGCQGCWQCNAWRKEVAVVVVIKEVISLCQQVCHCEHHPIWYAAMQKNTMTLQNSGTSITWYIYI